MAIRSILNEYVSAILLVAVYQVELAGAAETVKPGRWDLLVPNGGVSAMHMATTHLNTVVMFDRTNFGPSQLLLGNGRCRDNPKDLALTHDCWAHSIEYNIGTNEVRPLMVFTDTWCSSGAFAENGTLVQTGGYRDGAKTIRNFNPCGNSMCDWNELEPGKLSDKRWYSSNQILPDKRIIVIGGTKVFTYEFVPKSNMNEGSFSLPFLREINKPNVENNLYPFLHLCSDGNLFIFANKDSILLDYKNNNVVRKFPSIPGGPRNYPSSGSSVMLPLLGSDGFQKVEVLICGGAAEGGYEAAKAGRYTDALDSCGRMVITDPNPSWAMETMPAPRVMGDMLILPNGEIIIINGAEKGAAGWQISRNPSLSPFLYRPNASPGQRFTVLGATSIPRLYHSTANLLPDGRILVGGSNPNRGYSFTGVLYPTELRIEAYSPYYLDDSYKSLQPTIIFVSFPSVTYGTTFIVGFSLSLAPNSTNIEVNVYAPPFTTHTNSMNQRLLTLSATTPIQLGSTFYTIVTAPPSSVAAPPGYYMLFVVNAGIPSVANWIHFF
eukprot:Gb_22122 [translate_table: standard]